MVQWDAADYARNSTAQLGWARELLAKLKLCGSERVLDIGCGDGKITAEIARRVPHGRVVGVDKSEEMVRFASEAFAADQFPNLGFAHGDASDLGFREEFDVVFSNATLHWVIDHLPVLRGLRRALKPGGRALLQMAGSGNAAEVFALMEEARASDRWAGYFSDFAQPYGFHSPERYHEWLSAAGLRPVRAELIPKDMTQRGAEGIAGWMRTTWLPYTQRIPEHLRDEFLGDIVDQYLERFPPDADGVVHVRMTRLEVEATRPGNRSPINGLWILG